MENPLTKAEQKLQDTHRSAAILHAIEIESNFKLYSYRIIDHDVFLQRTLELTQLLTKTLKNG
jgi:hypothetical protein